MAMRALDVFDFVFPAVPEVFPAEMPIELPREDVIDQAVGRKALRARVFARLQFVQKASCVYPSARA